MEDVFAQAAQWIADDPDGTDRTELAALVESARDSPGAYAELADRFVSPLTFGTAGLRGAMGAGPNRMNTAVVTTASAGLASYLRTRLPAGFHVVIGFDGRHRSADFARTAAGVIVAAGGRASLMPRMLPTPVLAFATRYLDADAGVMVTASHNPPADNGYKVYLGERISDAGGAQLVAPADGDILAEIVKVGAAGSVPVADAGWQIVGESVLDAYVTSAAALAGDAPRNIRVALTAMHGVGAAMARRVFTAAGFTDLFLVPSQAEPDPDFPTVAFPNPEEPGALADAIETASRVGVDVIVALDPDADRCAIAVPDPSAEGGWRQLTGDELGGLLGEQVARERHGDRDAVLSRSLVSSSLLARIAESHGVSSAETLTGFKWITRAAGIVFGYEEAIGYCVDPDSVRDKDGITAGLKSVALAARAKQAQRTLDDELADLAVAHGLHLTSPLTFRVEDVAQIAAGMVNLRSSPPTQLAGSPVSAYDDLATGWNGLPATDGVRIYAESGDRVVVRPSGTEPKLKCYLEVVETVESLDDLPRARAAADRRLDAIRDEMRAVLKMP